MIGFFSRTGTRRNLAIMRGLGWGILIAASKRASSEHRDEGFARVMIDNGAWSCRAEVDPLEAWRAGYRDSFEILVHERGESASLIVLPDIVAGGLRSLEHSLAWAAKLRGLDGLLLPVQDGMVPSDVEAELGEGLGIFVGGSDDPRARDGGWKWRTLASMWGPLAKRTGCWLHVGRAGSGRQVERSALAGAHSFDTSQPSRYACKAPGLDNARRQTTLWGPNG